jgi:hypothetical protein
MAQSAYASGPISFATGGGREIYVPLDIIGIDASGTVTIPNTYEPADNAAIVKWLQYLLSIGELVALPAPPPAALDLVAKNAGTAGNHISASVGYLPSTATYTLTVKQRDFFAPLTAANAVATVNALGDGLLRIGSIGSSFAPAYAEVLSGSGTGVLGSGAELVLATAAAGEGASHVSVAIDATTPKLTVTWSNTATIVPPTSLPTPASQKSQQDQIAAAFAVIAVTSSPDVSASAVVVVPTGPTLDTPFDSTNKLALPGASGTALTLTAVPAQSSDLQLQVATSVTARVTPGASSYALTITRTDTYTGANLTPAKLAAGLGTTGDGSTAPTTGTVTGGLVVVRTNPGLAAPATAFANIATSSVAVQVADGRYELGLDPSAGLSVAPAATLSTNGTWSVAVAPMGAGGAFSLEVTYTNSGNVDTTKSLADQGTALDAVVEGLLTATPHALLLPQGGGYTLTGGSATTRAKLTIPARS